MADAHTLVRVVLMGESMPLPVPIPSRFRLILTIGRRGLMIGVQLGRRRYVLVLGEAALMLPPGE